MADLYRKVRRVLRDSIPEARTGRERRKIRRQRLLEAKQQIAKRLKG